MELAESPRLLQTPYSTRPGGLGGSGTYARLQPVIPAKAGIQWFLPIGFELKLRWAIKFLTPSVDKPSS